jgi:hypothetical protein
VPAAAEGAVDYQLAGLRVDQRDEFGGEDWNVLGGHVGQCGHRRVVAPPHSTPGSPASSSAIRSACSEISA